MTETIESLRKKMDAAAKALDFEEAKRLRDIIILMSGGASAESAGEARNSGISRQRPGAMGLGTGQPRITPPEDWMPPPRPDPKTRGRRKVRPS